MTHPATTMESSSKEMGCVMFSLVMTWIGAIVGLLILGVMVLAGVLVDSERN